ncbi:hypothetical protein [Rubrobacter aplysinae]|uniref:hypothetical protein n=1 Tax=Rubrobacter aplysinae TaxID=909625 RepID=UPI00064BCF7D|nr:hypothetical protein [Rubrobacter aplysinae]
MSSTSSASGQGVGRWAATGAAAGAIAGIVFIVFEMIMAGLSGPSPFGPLRLISAIVLGQGALPPAPTIGLPAAIIVGLIVHFVLATVFGVIFGAILGGLSSRVGALAGSRGALIGAATAGGLLLWIVNFFVIAPIAFPWFTMANQVVQFFAHTFFFGTAFGLLLAGRINR